MYNFICKNGHEHKLNVSGCRVCPTEECGAIGTSTKIVPITEKLLTLVKSYFKNAKRFNLWGIT